MIRIGICDDMPDEVRKQKSMIQAAADQMHLNMELLTFESSESLLQEIQMYGHMDILFLDIEMEGKSGIEAAKIIRETDFDTLLIFVSAYDQYCRQMIEVQPFAFVDKPVTAPVMERMLQKAMRVLPVKYERFRFSCQKHRYSIPLHQIMYFESMGRKICIHGIKEQYYFYGKLNAVEKEIARFQTKFVRIQISYYVNLNFIKEWNYDSIVMDNDVLIPISKKYRKALKQHYITLLGKE